METSIDVLKQKANNLRIHSLVSTSEAGSGHPTTCLSAADIISALFFRAMRYDPTEAQLLQLKDDLSSVCLLYTSPSPRDRTRSRMPSSA